MTGWTGCTRARWFFRHAPATCTTTVAIAMLVGCGSSPAPSGGAGRADSGEGAVLAAPAMPQSVRDTLLDGAMNVLGRLEGYDEASAFAQVFDRLNQWSHGVAMGDPAAASEWRLDPLVELLPSDLRPLASAETLGSSVFEAVEDVRSLRDQRWLADIAATARGDALDDIDVARNLFDWTIRSLAVSTDPPMVPTPTNPGSRWFLPGEVLLSGRASPAQRAWIFLELLRHAGLDGVMLATGDAAKGTLRPWIPALISGGEAHLFDPAYGMPIPGPEGKGIATARQAAADPSILRSMSVSDRPYPLQSADVAALSVLVPATNVNLARRMLLLDAHLAGNQKIDLVIDAGDLATRALAALPGKSAADRVRLWEFPWETLRRRTGPSAVAAARAELSAMALAIEEIGSGEGEVRRIVRPLYAGRVREFRGDLDGPEGAKMAYLAARPSAAQIAEVLKQVPPEQVDAARRLYESMKQDATYWLGVLTLAEGEYETAIDYLGRMTLDAAPDGRWADAARLNLAGAKAAVGQTAEAVKLLRADPSPQRFGSRLAADQLEKKSR
jgi:hypothetical protein